MRDRTFWLAMGTVILVGCAATTTPRLDARFGDTVRASRAQQTLNPDASRNTDPVAGIDGVAAKNTIDRYRDSFKVPPPTFNVINIGGGVSAENGGQ